MQLWKKWWCPKVNYILQADCKKISNSWINALNYWEYLDYSTPYFYIKSKAVCTYMVWQKNNETDFLLTMNFILFTNQGYPLQNSSLGQLQSHGGVVSIVRSGAGRLLLVYLSAHRLPSSGYYPKYQNGALSSGFWAGGSSHRDWDPANRGLRNHRNAFFCQKFVDGDCHVTWDIVVVQHPSACDAWSHTCHPFPESFKDSW